MGKDYLSKKNTTCINGIFILIVFISHLRTYIDLPPTMEMIWSRIGQLMVAMFLFNSGYGIGVSIIKKGMDYIKKIPKNRILKVWLLLIPAVCMYAIMDILMDIDFTVKQFVLSILAWLNLGNSNWYIFVILWLYFITFISFMIAKGKKVLAFAIHIILTAVLIYLLYKTVPDYWYNTISAYVFGLFFAFVRKYIEKYIGILTFLLAVAMTVWLRFYSSNTIIYLLMTVFFCFGICCAMKYVKVYNSALHWIGEHLFEIYILMRIPMVVLISLSYFKEHEFIYSGLCFLITLIMAWGYKMLWSKSIGKLFKKQ